jgi:hypothetical protein
MQMPLAEIKAVLDLEPAAAAGTEINSAQWQLVSESSHAWGGGRRARPTDLGMRITYLATTPLDERRGPNCDFAVPLDDVGADAVASRRA